MDNELFSKLQIEPAVLLVGQNLDELDRSVLDYKWNMVLTTCADSEVQIRMSKNNRNLTAVYDVEEMRSNLLDPINLHVVKLFGKTNDPEEIDEQELQVEAINKLNRTTEIIRKSGIIVFEHFDEDIITDRQISIGLKRLATNQRQLYIFNIGSEAQKNYKKLVDNGIAVLFEESINDYFEEYQLGTIHSDASDLKKAVPLYIDAETSGLITSIQKKDLLETDSFATLLNIPLLEKERISPAMYEDYFYSFLRNSVKAPQWYGYKYGFNITRNFEDKLYKMTKKGLESIGEKNEKPLLLVGQTCSGKSVALAALAYKIFQEKKYPVIFISDPDVDFYNNGKRAFSALDMLIRKLEDAGASGTLLIWDASCYSTSRNVINKLYAGLRARGRKVYLVASAYENENSENSDDSLLDSSVLQGKFWECKTTIQIDDEKEQLKEILIEKCGISTNDVKSIFEKNTFDQNFLALFYQSFYMLRNEMAAGVDREAQYDLKEIIKKLNVAATQKREKETFSHTFAQLFKNLEVVLENNGIDVSTPQEKVQEYQDSIQRKVEDFIRCIAVCAQFKINMPYDMSLRILGTDNHSLLPILLKSTFFVLKSDQYNNRTITIRTPLEARMYLRANHLNPMDQVDDVIKILKNLNPAERYGQVSEVALCEKLIRTIGPNGDQRNTYKNGYSRIIDALGELREREQIKEIKLIEQEITYIREYYGKGDFDVSTKKYWLERAIEISNDALDDPYILNGSDGDKNTLLVETANSKLLLFDLQGTADGYSDELVRKQLIQVIMNDSQNYHAYVTLFKALRSEYGRTSSSEGKAKLLEQMLAWKEKLDIENNDVVNSSYFQDQYSEVTYLLNDTEIVQKNIDDLVSKGSAAGIYINAKKILAKANVEFREGVYNSEQYEACKSVYTLLCNPLYEVVVNNSESCQYMKLNIVWLLNNGGPIFQKGERWTTAICDSAWSEILYICSEYIKRFVNSSDKTNRVEQNIKYLKALALAHLGEYSECIRTFRTIAEDGSLGSPRTYTMHIICDDNGNPKTFHGTIESYNSARNQRTGKMQIKEFGQNLVYFFGPNIETTRLDPGDYFDDIQIGLGYIGPKAFRGLKKNEAHI